MDGVVTRTAELHARAWKDLFDAYLREREARGQPGFAPFDPQTDYLRYVDGKPRQEGARSFLAARGIELPSGTPEDPPEAHTLAALAARKDALFARHLEAEGVAVYPSSTTLIERLRARGIRAALVTSSRHGRELLERAGLGASFDVVLDGNDAARLGLRGKPDPDSFLKAAELLQVLPPECAVVEDAAAGVAAGEHGEFGLVVGVDRGGNRAALVACGADVVVGDLAELDVDRLEALFLAQAAARRTPDALEEAWRVEQEGFDPAREHEMESLYTVGNGYLGVRGALDMPLPGSQADLFVAGIYDRKHPGRPYSELEFLTLERGDHAYSELVSAPFPFRTRIVVGGTVLDMAHGPWRALHRQLDLRRALVRTRYLFQDAHGRRTTIEAWRCASAADLHLLLQEVSVSCDNHESLVEIDTSLLDPECAANHPHLTPLPASAPAGTDLQLFRTQASDYRLALASRARLADDELEGVYFQEQGTPGRPLRVRRLAAVATSRDGPDPAAAATAKLAGPALARFEQARRAHEERWAAFWDRADVRVEGSIATTQALRFLAYHLRAAADHDPRVSIGARTLSGRAYEGHVFWDVEVFMLPFFAHVCPDIARHLVLYRWHTLGGARQRARELGYRGACYAWESTVTGADVTPREIVLRTSGKAIPIYTGFEQIHVTADVAYGVWYYYDATHDDALLREAGAEILFETARFWVSRCVRRGTRYHIEDVVGPDEYHHTVDDNAYTNWMAQFNLEKALWARAWLAERYPDDWARLRAALGLTDEEVAAWEELARDLYLPGPNDDGVIEQFRGFFDLEPYPLTPQERFNPPLRRLFEAEKVNRSQLIKQADVLMLPFLFPERFTDEVLAANYAYYEPRTDHGSSLSPSVHAALAARLGLRDQAQHYWRRSLWLDLSNNMGNAALGVHAACMGGTWRALVFGLLGVRFGPDGPVLTPGTEARVPGTWNGVELRLQYRGRDYPLRWERGAEAP
jgi:HAD superfamily hydrolase (TIGR01509 family)